MRKKGTLSTDTIIWLMIAIAIAAIVIFVAYKYVHKSDVNLQDAPDKAGCEILKGLICADMLVSGDEITQWVKKCPDYAAIEKDAAIKKFCPPR